MLDGKIKIPAACRHALHALLLIIGASVMQSAMAQGFQERAKKALSEPFVGITAQGTVQPGLFEIVPSGVEMRPVTDAANAVIAAMNAEQLESLRFPVDNPQWRRWINIHKFPREGVSLREMSVPQRQAVYALLRESLSAKGYQTTRDIMRLNHHLGELVSDFTDYGEHRYWLALMGTPSATEPWGWQLEGHHLIINFFVLGDQVVMTPTFMGSEPVTARSGKYAGVEILQPEQNEGLAFMRSLSQEQQKKARIGARDEQNANKAEAFKDNTVIPYEGLPAAAMAGPQREALLALAGLHIGNMQTGHAAAKMHEISAHLDETYFAWKGDTEDESVFYYRIHSPVILIEFDHAGTIALDGPWGKPNKRHIHTVVRTPNGNDYGKDLLRQHYEAHEHGADHTHQN
ncbi:DUF3500 domain-containing protein [Nisaea acidiphila]|uniref:DUF3500 domain-containing protein n=1 Tax=Nisaea acidiphila TaxID=1862145 RepID=A0A9J7APA5_9PROT|nr:DUF3500 domain-containing protein [Nisaea acidiphila]UUX49451.1 DUF3500 domain-containing protein [Nisaea acidiphila]